MYSEHLARRFLDILENAERIRQYTANIESLDQFRADSLTMDAVERCWQRIAEAAAQLGPQAEKVCSEVLWVRVRQLGDELWHDYDSVQSDVVWLVVTQDLPAMVSEVQKTVDALKANTVQPT